MGMYMAICAKAVPMPISRDFYITLQLSRPTCPVPTPQKRHHLEKIETLFPLPSTRQSLAAVTVWGRCESRTQYLGTPK
jgi:hypothetical protein